MTTPRQRKVKTKVSRKSKKSLNFCMPLIKKAWDSSKTLSQNYSEIGLQSFLNGKAGGNLDSSLLYAKLKDKLYSIKDHIETEWISPSQLTESDDSGKVQVEHLIGEPVFEYDDRVKNLGSKVNLKKLRNFAMVAPVEKESTIVDQLRELSSVQTVKRNNSDLEVDMLHRLQEKYGNDYERMSRDYKLNKYQLSAGQLKKKYKRLQE